MSTIAEMVHKERKLEGAPRVYTVDPENAQAVTLALAHARARLALPAFTIVWCARRGANFGETWWHHDGRIEVWVNGGTDLSPRQVAWTLLHELKHVADGQQFCGRFPQEAEDTANAFAFRVTEREAEADFLRLNWRRPSMRR